MPGRLRDKVALITGGTSGIGEATVRLFLAEGAKVVFTGRNEAAGRAQAEALGPGAAFIRTDVRREADTAAAVAGTVERFGRLDALFLNAGGGTRGDVESFTEEDYRDAMDLLLGSVLYGVKHAAPVMKAQGGGAIIANASVAAMRAEMGGYLYSVAKAGVVHAVAMAGIALGRHGVTVNAISPGGIATPIFFGGGSSTAASGGAEAKLAHVEGNLAAITSLGRTGVPTDIANAALFLASDDGRFINCHNLVVDAGMVAEARISYHDVLKDMPA